MKTLLGLFLCLGFTVAAHASCKDSVEASVLPQAKVDLGQENLRVQSSDVAAGSSVQVAFAQVFESTGQSSFVKATYMVQVETDDISEEAGPSQSCKILKVIKSTGL